jgi:hypothetical protein
MLKKIPASADRKATAEGVHQGSSSITTCLPLTILTDCLLRRGKRTLPDGLVRAEFTQIVIELTASFEFGGGFGVVDVLGHVF